MTGMWKVVVVLLQLWIMPCLSIEERSPGRTKAAMESSTRIIGGTAAPRDRYPYAVSLETSSGAHVCGGSLIDSNIVLSAAHCAESVDQVVIGRYNRSDDTESFETFDIDKQVAHPGYTDDAFPFDFLLIKLNDTSEATPVKINTREEIPYNNMELTVMGSGVTVQGSGTAAELLHEASVNYVANEICALSEDPNFIYDSYRGKISSDMLCAADSGEDSCQGDSGSPLIVKGTSAELDLQVGLVSWGYGCALEAFPGVYGRVSHEYDWIQTNVCDLTRNAAEMFDCGQPEEEEEPPTSSPVQLPPVPITVVLQLDSSPGETGWRIEDMSGKVMREVAPGTYSAAKQTMEETVFLPGGEKYLFIVSDTGGNGFCCDDGGAGYYQLVVGYAGGTQGEVLAFGNGVFEADESEKQHEFVAPAVFADDVEEDTAPPTATPPQELEQFPITIAIKFDKYPEEVGWRVERLSAEVEEIKSVTPGIYSTPNDVVVEHVWVQKGGLYNFVIYDIFEDGTCCKFGGGWYNIFVGTTDTTQEDALIYFESGEFGAGREHAFIALPPDEIDSENTEEEESGEFLTLEIKFDSFPQEVGWILEAETDEVAVEKEIAVNNMTVVDYALAGTYSPDLALQLIRLTIPISSVTDGFRKTFMFTLTDSSEDGLCCGFGSGGFTVYYGPEEGEKVLVSGTAENTARDSHVFYLSDAEIFENYSSANSLSRIWRIGLLSLLISVLIS